MANTIKPKRSNTANKVPTTSDLSSGEFGVNMADQKSYINNGTTVVQVGAGKIVGLQDVTVTSPTSGQTLTWNGTAWVNSNASVGTVTSVGITPSTGVTVSNSPITSSGNITVGLSTKLTAIQNLSGAGFITQNGSGAIAGRTIQAGTGISVAHGNGSSQDPTISNSGVLGVTATSPVASSGGQNPVISMTQASGSVNGWLSSTDWNTFNNKTSNTGTVTSVSGTGGYGGLTLSGTVTSSGNITLGGTPTGTWPIAISGNAGSATTASTATTATNQSGGTVNATTGAFSGVASFSAGSQTAPSITRTGDTNTGIFFPADDTIAFTEGGLERMRLNADGDFFVGKQVVNYRGLGLQTELVGRIFGITSNLPNPNFFCSKEGSTGDVFNVFYNGGFVGGIATNGSSVSYNTTSDYRLKENIQPMIGALDKVKKLKPCTYTWKADGTISQGFIAHELAEVIPDCVTGEKDGLDEKGNPKYQGVDSSFLVATLTAAIQEQQEIIASIKLRIEDLESKG